ncbi:huntingtin-interacting protein 1 [Drosophila albomicans]|uniref:Huntingtin-interacting protein 1 n=1 Tax=Drosophila albomicans TaxID=7291 RepID=A0A6P8Y2T1_DROAB|nr:huntingtin-interacting protein 1 [Drosophila albomicans]
MTTNAEKDFFHLNQSVSKALNGLEAPLKSKHARSAIIIIHKSKEARSFWAVITRQPIMESRFTAWKFCHLLHKVLREGPKCAIQQSLKHSNMILEIGKLWGHLHGDIGNCIKAYSKFLVTKLNFHEKNRMYPGTLLITFADIAHVANGDLNFYFQLCVEIFDYLDDIIALQVAVFSSINTYRISSMTQAGQCRLAPLITLIQDSNPLYDMSVRLMFKLHEKLPNDVLSGHRERFAGIFARLKLFYESVRPLQYFHDLITVPQLPEHSPNFKSQVDFGSYVPPVVHVQSEPDPVVEDLVDTNSANNIVEQDQILVQRIEVLESMIDDKEDTIRQLKDKLDGSLNHFNGLEQTYKHNIVELQRSNTALCNDLESSKELVANLRMQKDELELQLTNNPILIQKVFEEEEKQKLSSEKFNKLKVMYTQIRDEHISLLRQHGEFTKSLNKEKQANAELSVQIKDLNNEILKKDESIEADKETTAKLLLEIENQKTHSTNLESVGKEMKAKYEAIIQKKESENLEVHSMVNVLKESETELGTVKLVLIEKEQKLAEAESLLIAKDKEIADNLKTYEEKNSELSTKNKVLEETLQKDSEASRGLLVESETKLKEKENALQEAETSLTRLREEKVTLEKLVREVQVSLSSKEREVIENLKAHEEKYSQLSIKHKELEEIHQKDTKDLRGKLSETESRLQQKENALQLTESSLAKVSEEKVSTEKLLSDVQIKLKQREEDLVNASNKNDSLSNLNQQCQNALQMMRNLTIQTVKEMCSSKLTDVIEQPMEGVLKISSKTETLLSKIMSSAQTPNEGNTEKLHDILYLGYYFIELYDQCDMIYKSTTEIEKGQDILSKVRTMCPDLTELFVVVQKDENSSEIKNVGQKIQNKLSELNELVRGLMSNFENSVDLDKLIQTELKEMDIAIEEAATKIIDLLSKSRETDSKIKLEVNEKILEACTSLMESIKILILKSRVLQQEIVSSQKGNATENEFYKRNSQWSEGLISASKSVAKGANYLVEAANNAINSESGQNFELIVAAQEIAACTVQLVMASKVKANLNSPNLSNLTLASRNVTKATGVVVATVKDGNARTEQQQDLEFAKLTPSQLKTMEMEIQVKVLELEQALQTQRLKLSSFRKEHYQKTEY